VQRSGCRLDGATLGDHGTGSSLLPRHDWAADVGASCASCGDSGAGALSDEAPFKFGHGSDDLKEKHSARCRGIKWLGHAHKCDPLGSERVELRDHV